MKVLMSAGLLLGALFAEQAEAGSKAVKFQAKVKIGNVAVAYSNSPFHRPAILPKKVPKKWVPGHYEVVLKKVWVPGHFQEVWIDPVYNEYPYYGNCTVKVLVDPGYYKIVWIEGCYKTEREKVWVPGYWVDCH